MNYHVDFNSLEEYKKELDKNIEIINEELRNLYKSFEQVTWEGAAYEVVSNNINDRLNVLANMTKILSLLSKFMETAANNYQEGMEEIKKSFDEVLDEIKKAKLKRGIEWEETLM